ncbi:MFS family permease [Allocatelliglobosispora scoriae]|uniref:MFS family permease n=1 Tax=Allocatelliglobosispora scoriae TaxID=643052 RepID=A0A841BWE6_9ACTN|nr:hypothetical protein [Allocatelliglobosispora scoriae]MBB5871051.1 MFS family permease [Allocatelliglobosispora scoriae]
MSVRGWGGPIATAIGGAVVVGAAQLGLGYGLGIIGWRGDAAGWSAALAWTMWVSAFAVFAGALAGQRSLNRHSSSLPDDDSTVLGRVLWRITLAVAAALGGLAVVPLTALPARTVPTSATSAPAFIVGWHAAAGVVIGLVLAIIALNSRAIATNLIATGAWWALIALVAVIDAAAGGRGLVPAQLSAWRFTGHGVETIRGSFSALQVPGDVWWESLYLPGAGLILGAALLIGAFSALAAARSGDGWIGVALSGAAGPALLALVFIIVSPTLTEAPTEQVTALLIAPYAVVAGLVGSVAMAILADRPRRPAPRHA